MKQRQKVTQSDSVTGFQAQSRISVRDTTVGETCTVRHDAECYTDPPLIFSDRKRSKITTVMSDAKHGARHTNTGTTGSTRKSCMHVQPQTQHDAVDTSCRQMLLISKIF